MVKIYTICLAFFLTLFSYSSVYGTVYTTTADNTWSPSTPSTNLNSSDEFIINHEAKLYGLNLQNGGKITVHSGGELELYWSADFRNGSKIIVKNGGSLTMNNMSIKNYGNITVSGNLITTSGTFENKNTGSIVLNSKGDWELFQETLKNYGDITLKSNVDWSGSSMENKNNGTIVLNSKLSIKQMSFSNKGDLNGYGRVEVVNGDGSFSSDGEINGCSGNSCIPPSTIGDVTYLYYHEVSGVNAYTLVTGGNISNNSCSDKLLILENSKVATDAVIGDVLVAPGIKLTIKGDKSLSVCNGIVNEGIVLIQNNGSLVQTSSADLNSGSGKYRIRRKGSNSSLAYNSWSSPFKSAKISKVFPNSNPCDIFAFEGSTQSWSYDYASGYTASCNGNSVTFTSGLLAGGDGIMDQGRGYFVPGTASSTRTLNGQVNNGDVTIDVYETPLGNNPDWNLDDWNLVGNPYPCAIDLEQFYLENQGVITGSFYFWVDDQLNGTDYHQSDDYAVYAENVGTTANGGQAKRYVAAGQAFWVYAKQNGTITFKNNMRVVGNNSNLFKTDGANENTFVYLDIINDSNNFNQCAIGFNPTSTDGFDEASDAPKGDAGSGVSLGSLIDGNPYSIQAFEKLETFESHIVPLSLYTNWAGNHTFHVSQFDGVGSNISVYLRDTQLNIDTDLKLSDYVLFLDTGDYTNRFEIIFENTGAPTNVEDQTKNTNFIKVYQNDNEVYVETIDQKQTIESVVLYDLVGKELIRSNELHNSLVVLDGAILQTGTYILKSKSIDGTVQTVKFLFVE